MINLSNIKPEKQNKPPRIILYGTPKVGKSTFCANIKNALFLDIENGTGNLNVARLERDQLDTLTDVLSTLEGLATQEHDFKSVVIDSADFLERIIQEQVGGEHNTEFSKIGYGRGEVRVASLWRDITQKLDALVTNRSMSVWLIAHEMQRKINEPNQDTYDKYTLSMSQKSVDVLQAWADAILFAEEETNITSKKAGMGEKIKAYAGDRVLHTKESPRHLAGNRYNLPDVLPFEWDAFCEAYKTAIK